MHERSDIIFGTDIYVEPNVNDLPLMPSDAQNIGNVINAFPGWYKDTPQIGVGCILYLNSPNKIQKLNASIQLNLKIDGYNSLPVSQFSNGVLLSVTANATLI